MLGNAHSVSWRAGFHTLSAIVALLLLISVEAFAQIGAVRVDMCWIARLGRPPLDLAAAPVPCPNAEDGLARSSTSFFYTTNGGGFGDTIYKINLSGVTVGSVVFPNTNFQALAYATDTDSIGGRDLLYALDIVSDQLFVVNPATMTPGGAPIPVDPEIGVNAISGGQSTVFVQQLMPTGVYEIWKYNTITGSWILLCPTPLGGAVAFDGLSFIMGNHIGTVMVTGGSDLWRYKNPGPWNLIPGGMPTVPFPLSAMGAYR